MSIIDQNSDAVQDVIPIQWIGQSEPTPVELLIEPTDHGDPGWAACECERAIPRYMVKIAGNPNEPGDGYLVWDRMNNEPVKWERWHTDALNHADDLNNEDFEPLLIAGRPWYQAPYPVPAWDGPRATPTRV